MDPLIGFLLDVAKGHPFELILLAFVGVGCFGYWLNGVVQSFASKKSVEDLATLNGVQHLQLTAGFADSLKGFREDLKLNDLAMKEKIGDVYERLNPLADRLATLEGEHTAIAGHCVAPRSPGGPNA